MTATETITSNARVYAADPYVEYKKAKTKKEKDVPEGIGEEDIVCLVLPYIRSAREGVLRLGELLEKYGTYEANGIAFNDVNEVWWLETIGGHHWIAKKVPDEVVVVNPNQFGMDSFDLEDAFGEQKAHLCSGDLREFIAENHLDCNQNGEFNPRYIFGSHEDSDHIYNTPRAWFMGRYLNPTTHTWDGPDAEFTPESDNIPWCFVPEKKVAIEDIKYLMSSHYQGTIYDNYGGKDAVCKGKYRVIGVANTDTMSICQIRADVPAEIAGLEWVGFGSGMYNALLPVYPHVDKLPDYLSKVTTDVALDNFFWSSRMLGALADPHFNDALIHVGRYQDEMQCESRRLVREYDKKIAETGDVSLSKEANDKLCAHAKDVTQKAINRVTKLACEKMRSRYHRGDN